MSNNNVFQSHRVAKHPKSAFDLSHDVKLTMNMGELVPCYIQEVLPSDEFQVRTDHMIRFAPMVYPLMHRVNTYIHFFFVPNRIVWDEWEDFITGGRLGTSAPTMPTVTADGVMSNADPLIVKLGDYLGLPNAASGTSTLAVSDLPFRAYQLIYNDYYRDQNTTAEVDVHTASYSAIHTLRDRDWETL